MKFAVSHAMGVYIQNHLILGLPYRQVAFTTLNELFNVQSGVAPDNGAAPNTPYLAIGNGGHINATTAEGVPYQQLILHDPRDTGLVNHVPFILREAADDISVAQRANYAMRVPVVIGGKNYIAYYLRKMDMSQVVVQLLINTVKDGVTTSVPWVPTSANLRPTRRSVPNTGATPTNGQYVAAQATTTVPFSDADAQELINAAMIMYNGNPDLAIISELALVIAAPKVVSASVIGGGTIQYTEAVSASIASTLSAFYHIPSLNKQLSLTFDIGGAEALFATNDGTTGP